MCVTRIIHRFFSYKFIERDYNALISVSFIYFMYEKSDVWDRGTTARESYLSSGDVHSQE